MDSLFPRGYNVPTELSKMNSVSLETVRPRPILAFAAGCAIGVLGGLIGLGGAEFRLPVLITLFGVAAIQAVRINILISLATVLASAAARMAFGTLWDISRFSNEIAAMAIGGIVGAWVGVAFISSISTKRLLRIIAILLAVIACLLLVEALFGDDLRVTLPSTWWILILIGLSFGLVIGFISSLLGVAGGELIIPTMVFIFGMDVKSAGTASLIISTPSLLVGVARHQASGAYKSVETMSSLIAPMAAGSLFGAAIGATALPFVASNALKIVLAVILILSAVKLARKAY